MDGLDAFFRMVGGQLSLLFAPSMAWFWIYVAMFVWALVAYKLWTHIPHTPNWSATRSKPMVWWKAVGWPLVWSFWICWGLAFFSYHGIKGLIVSLFIEPVKARIKYAQEVENNPYVDAFCNDVHCDNTCGKPPAPIRGTS